MDARHGVWKKYLHTNFCDGKLGYVFQVWVASIEDGLVIMVAWFYYCLCKPDIMIYSIQNQVFQKFIEAPKQFTSANSNFMTGSDEKAAHHADLSQGYDVQEDVNANIFDTDIPYYEINERYD